MPTCIRPRFFLLKAIPGVFHGQATHAPRSKRSGTLVMSWLFRGLPAPLFLCEQLLSVACLFFSNKLLSGSLSFPLLVLACSSQYPIFFRASCAKGVMPFFPIPGFSAMFLDFWRQPLSL